MICKSVKRFLVVGLILVAAVVLSLSCHGCTIHFKGESVELDVERQRVETNTTYHLEKVELFGGSGS